MMTRLILIAVAVFALLGGAIYFSGSYDTASAVVLTLEDLFSSPPPAKPAVAAAPPKNEPLSGFPQKFSNSLMIMDGGTPRNLDTHTLVGVKYYAFYYSASWCPPCRAFTPDLVSFYNSFKPSHPKFELIFVNLDRNESDMLAYMRNDSMPWPAIWYADIDNSELDAKKYCGEGIPCLVLVDADGNVLSDTFQSGNYTDPHHVINDIRASVP